MPDGARYAAVAVLAVVGSAGVLRGFIDAPRSSGAAPAAPAATPGPDEAASGGDVAARAESGEPGARLVDVNSATAAELDLLPGIGPALAARIIDHRESQGPFASVQGLDAVRGIGPKTVEKLAPFATAR